MLPVQIFPIIFVIPFFFSYSVIECCQPTKADTESRKKVLRELQTQFRQVYPSCKLQAYGSSRNGFGFRKSDLDVCVHVEENVCFSIMKYL